MYFECDELHLLGLSFESRLTATISSRRCHPKMKHSHLPFHTGCRHMSVPQRGLTVAYFSFKGGA